MISVIVILLILIAAGLTLAAHLTGTIQLGISAAALALVALLLAAWHAWADRRQQAPTQEQVVDDDAAESVSSQDDEQEPANSEKGAVSIGVVETGVEVVHVIPGRKRFHEPDCSSLAGRQSEELTREEAQEEGVAPCSICCRDRTAIRKVG